MLSSIIKAQGPSLVLWKTLSLASFSLAVSQSTQCDGHKKEDNKTDGGFRAWFGASPAQKRNNDGQDFSERFRALLTEAENIPTIGSMLDSGVPTQVGYGFAMGYSSGFCLKKVSKVLAFAAGGAFILLQSLSYSRYVNVNYKELQKDAEKALDLNQDGKVDHIDFQYAFDKINKVLGHQMPSGGGFAAGLLLGLRT